MDKENAIVPHEQGKNRFGFKASKPETDPMDVVKPEPTPVVVNQAPASIKKAKKPLTTRTSARVVSSTLRPRTTPIKQAPGSALKKKRTAPRSISKVDSGLFSPVKKTRLNSSVKATTNTLNLSSAPAKVQRALQQQVVPFEDGSIAKAADDTFQSEFLLNCKQVLHMRVHAKRHDYKGQLVEQKEIISSFRTCMKDMLIKRKAFVNYALEVEAQLTNTSNQLEIEIEDIRANEASLMSQLNILEKEGNAREAAITQAEAQMAKSAEIEAAFEAERVVFKEEATTRDMEITSLKQQLHDESTKLAVKVSEHTSLNEQLTSLREEHERAIVTHNENVNALTTQFEAQLSDSANRLTEVQAQCKELESQLKNAEMENAALLAKQNETAVQISQLEGEAIRGNEKEEHFAKEIERCEKQICELKDEIKRKEEQCTQMMTSFSQNQSFIQELTSQLNQSKASNQSKIDALQAENNDHKSQLLTLSHKHDTTVASLTAATSDNEQLTEKVSHVETELVRMTEQLDIFTKQSEATITELKETYATLSAEHASTLQAKKEKEEELSSHINEMTEQLSERDALTAMLQEEKAQLTAANAVLTASEQKLTETVSDLTTELTSLKENLDVGQRQQMEQISHMTVQAQKLQMQLSDKELKEQEMERLRMQVAFLLGKTTEQEAARRALHNTMQEMKGNIRVIVRVRPMLPHDGDASPAVKVQRDKKTLLLHVEDRNSYKFEFDQVFAPQAIHHSSHEMDGVTDTQAGIYEEVSDLVQSALDGYNVCLFSYGQTGSGKTWTMQGGKTQDQKGIIPRALMQIMQKAKDLTQQGWEYKLEASYLEIYNDNLIDLLNGEKKKGEKEKTLFIRQDPTMNNRLYVPGLTRRTVETQDDIHELIEMAHKKRSVAHTDMNSESSRSHAVFSLYLTGKNTHKSDQTLHGTLNLVDLAGSERLSRSGVEGKRLQETKNINKSLSNLADVFTSLANKSSHVPFRNSKLTYLLQNCLSNSGKTLMFINLSPTSLSSHESLCSLRFAQVVQKVVLGKAKKITQRASSSSSSSSLNIVDVSDLDAEEAPKKRLPARKRAASSSATHLRKHSAPLVTKRARRKP